MKVGVVGFGQMGCGIAQVLAQFGSSVLVYDQKPVTVEQNLNKLISTCEGLMSRGKLSAEEFSNIKNNIKPANSVSDFSDRDLLIEAIVENPNDKKKLFEVLNGILPESCIIATNTSSISVTWLASNVVNPSRFLGLHFMNPVPIMKLVEIIPGLQTGNKTIEAAKKLVTSIGKNYILAPDIPGFIVNRVLAPMILEGIRLYEQGCSKESIDQGLKLGANIPMGPLELADFVGLDTLLGLCDYIYEQTGDIKFKAPNTLRRFVEAGWLGKKSSKGFYDY